MGPDHQRIDGARSIESLGADLLRTLSDRAPRQLDLTNPDHLETVRSGAEALESQVLESAVLESEVLESAVLESAVLESAILESAIPTVVQLQTIEAQISTDTTIPISVRVSFKLASSRLLLQEIARPTHVSVVFAVFKEHQRILTADEHPAGEDFLRQKLRQLRWLFGPTPRHTWDLTVVDDGCPEGSGRMAQAILDQFADPGEEVRVLFLEEAIRERLPIVGDLQSSSQSRKGGSIRLGLWHATRNPRGSNHVALFTDADLSTHLGQIGLLLSPLVDSTCIAAVGSRREPSSVVVKAGARDARGKLFIYLWKRLIPQLRGIVDTQCGFKAFDANHLASWIEDTQDNGFSFDIEFLLRVQLTGPDAIVKVPVAWIDSEAASTTTDLEPYLPMLQSVVSLYRRELPASDRSEPFAQLVKRLDTDSFRTLTANIPKEIVDREPMEFDDFGGVSALDLAEAAGLR